MLTLIGVIYLILATHTVCGCCNFYKTIEGFEEKKKDVKKEGLQNKNKKEGFAGLNDENVDASSWSMPDLTMTNGQPNSAGAKNILDRTNKPLPNDQMFMFASTQFKPECLSSYSSSTGGACMTMDQYKMLTERGGNNVPYSEY
jgi:hypothetical protein